jgi:hypothetical protein
MLSLWRVSEALAAGLVSFSVGDMALEFCLIHLLRSRHRELWIEVGSPKASPWGYVYNSFNARKFVMSQEDGQVHDRFLSRYCRVYRTFNVLFSGFVVLAPVVFLAVVVGTLFRR